MCASFDAKSSGVKGSPRLKGAAIEDIKRQHSHLVEETGATMTIQ